MRRVLSKLRHPLRPRTYVRQGEYVTFRPEGFAWAPDLPKLMCRNYYELKYLRRALARTEEFGIARERSLEIGCGFGRLSPFIAEQFERHEALDINQWALSQARECYPNIHFQSASATELPFEDAVFDVVVTWTVLQHVPNHLVEKALGEIRRVAKAKSLVVLCEATRFADQNTDENHTHDRTVEFYAGALSGRELLVSEYLTELDQVPGLSTPGRLMVFGPASTKG